MPPVAVGVTTTGDSVENLRASPDADTDHGAPAAAERDA